MPAGADVSDRRELSICLAIAAAIVALQSFVPLAFEQVFDSDQAVYGLMAKHLSEGRAFPLYFYGQNYMLGVQSWLAVPFFWIGGPTVAMLRSPLVLLNLSVALGFIWFLRRQGLRPRLALLAALPVIAFTPAKAMEFGFAYGAGIEPLGYALVLWLLRDRPLAFGAVLGFGTLHREFVFLALPALAIASVRHRPFWTMPSLAWRAAGFAIVWIAVDLLKRNVNFYGPSGGTYLAGSVTLGASTFAQWLSFDVPSYLTRIRELLTWGIPEMMGANVYPLRRYSIPSALEYGSMTAAVALGVACVAALVRVVWLRYRSGGSGQVSTFAKATADKPSAESRVPSSEWRRFAWYLVALVVVNILIYGLNSGILLGLPPPLRYAIFAPLVFVALFATFFFVERSRAWIGAVAAALIVWAAGSVVDNGRLAAEFVKSPPPSPHREMADYLLARGIGYAKARYWDAYVITFFSRERVIVASTETIRISAYQAEFDRHVNEAVSLPRLPCEGGPQVAAWCVIGPPAR